MKYHNITHDDMLNGSGLRVVLWVSGCEHKCNGCHNPITWNPNDGLEFDFNARNEIYNALKNNYISGITFSGGDPLHRNNILTVAKFTKEIKEKYPIKNIWLYTGFLWEEIKDLPFMKYIDVLVDGKFDLEKEDVTLTYCGSSNQRLINVKESLRQNKMIVLKLMEG